MRTKKFMLGEEEIPTHYFNIQAVMPNKPLPFLNPATREPLKSEDLYPIFCKACADQELNQTDEWIPIPEKIFSQLIRTIEARSDAPYQKQLSWL